MNLRSWAGLPVLAGCLLASAATAHAQTVATTETQLTFSGTDARPAWSPTGGDIVFDSNRNGDGDLFIIPDSGGVVTQITVNPLGDVFADFSPDASKLVYTRNDGVSLDIYITIPDSGGTPVALFADSTTNDQFPTWSPDSTEVCWSMDGDLYIIPSTGGTPVQLTTDPAFDNHPSWSPDGTKIVFLSNRSGNNDIWTIPSAGGTATQVTTDTADDLAPDWSPLGDEIAFHSSRSGNNDIWVIPAAGGTASQVTTSGATDRFPDWAPDGKGLAFSRNNSIWKARFIIADVAVTKSVDDSTPDEGDTIKYTVLATNNGPQNASGVEVTDVLPAGVTYVSSVATQGSHTSGTGVWAIGAMTVASTDTLEITATVDAGTAGQVISNTAVLTASASRDESAANDSSSVDISVTAIDLAVTKTVDDSTPDEGGTIVYTVVLANAGPDAATNVELTDLLPAGVTYVSDTVTQGTYTDSTGVWAIASMAAASSDTLEITATVDAGTGGQTISNTGSVTASDQGDTNAGNDSDSADITVRGVDLAVTKTVDDAAPNEGGTIVYTVVLANAGPDAATGVEVTDLLPAGVTYVSDTATQGTYTDSTGVWAVGSVAASAADTLEITATVDAGTAGQTISNTATVTAVDQSDGNAANDSDSADITVTAVDLAVTKTVDDAVPPEGATITYTVVVANVGTLGATGVEITDLLPAGVTYVSDTATQGTYTDSTGVWAVGSVAASAADTLEITTTVDAGTIGQTIGNTATVTAIDQTDVNAANDSDSADVTVTAIDLAVTKTVDDSTPDEGGTIAYTVVLANAGPDAATGVEVTDSLPAGVTYVSDTATQGTYTDSTGVWTVGAVAASAADTLEITATVDTGTAGQTISNTVSVTASVETDTNAGNDSDSADVTVTAIDLAVTKTVDDSTPDEGGTIAYTVVLANAGPDAATGVEVTDLLPTGVTYVSDTATQGTYTDSTGVWAVGSLAASAADTLEITATVDAGAAGQTISNTATVTGSDQADTNAANDSDSADVTVRAVDVAVTKTVDDAAPSEGGTIVYTVVLANAGPDVATGVEVTDLLPAGVTYVSDTVTQGTYTSGTGVWTVGSVAAAAADTLEITAMVDAGTASQTISNTAAVTAADQSDTNATNDSDSADITVTAIDLAVTKTVDDAAPNEGATIVYTVVLANAGPDAATGVEVTDLLPTGVTYVSDTVTQGTYTSGTGVWTVGSVAAAAADTLEITAMVDAGTASQTISNTAAVTAADQSDTNATNDSDSADITVTAIDLAVTKTVDDAMPDVGDAVTYEVVLTNNGPYGATGVSATDLLPTGVTYVSHVATSGTYISGTGVWAVGSVTASAADTLEITATVDPGAAGQTVTNTATVTASDQADTDGANDSDSADITVTAIDLAVTKTVDDATPNEDGTINYTVVVTNNGPDGATGVSVADILPAGVTYVSDSPTQGTYAGGIWTVGAIATTASDSLTITATVDAGTAGQTITNTATVAGSDQLDTNAANNTAAVGITVMAIDLAVTKTVDDVMPNVGAAITYTVILTNSGPDAATGVEVTDLLPAGVTYVSDTSTQGSYDDGTGVWAIASMAAASSDTLAITATVDAGTASQTITNTASVTGVDQADTNTGNDSDSVDITVASSDLAVVKTVDDTLPDEGQTVVYTVVLTNNGPSPATSVEVTDLLPGGVTYVSDVPTQGTYNDGTGVWAVGSVAAAASDTLEITVTVDAGTSGQMITNTVSVTAADQADPVSGNDTASVDFTVSMVDLAIVKTVDAPMPIEGQTINFTVIVLNTGPDDASNVAVADSLPAGVTYASYIASQGVYGDATGLWTVGALAVGTADTLTITAVVDSGTAAQTITNTASLAAVDQTDSNAGNDSDTAVLTVASVDLAITKAVDDAIPDEGQTITYIVTAGNQGPDQATGVVVTDLLPVGVTFLSATPSQGAYVDSTGLWTVGVVDSGAIHTLSISATVDSATAGTTIVNTASLTAVAQTDINPSNDADSSAIMVTAIDIALVKTVSDSVPGENETILFQVFVTNNGPDTATGVEICDLLPAGLTLGGAGVSQGTYDDSTGIWTLGTVDTASVHTLEIIAVVDSGTTGTVITNTAWLCGLNEADTNSDNDSATAEISVGGVVPVEPPRFIPTEYSLSTGWPNPFRDRTTIQFDVPTAGMTDLSIFDVTGRLVRTLVNGQLELGRYPTMWDGRDRNGQRVSTGVYFVRLQSGTFRATKKSLRLE